MRRGVRARAKFLFSVSDLTEQRVNECIESFPFAAWRDSEVSFSICDFRGSVLVNAGSEGASCDMVWQLVNECSERRNDLSHSLCGVVCKRESEISFYFCGVVLQRVNECGMQWSDFASCDMASERESKLSFPFCDVTGQRVNECIEYGASFPFAAWRDSKVSFSVCDFRGSVLVVNAGSEGASCVMVWQLVNECSEQSSDLSLFLSFAFSDVAVSVSMNAASKGAGFPILFAAWLGGACEQENEIYFYFYGVASCQ